MAMDEQNSGGGEDLYSDGADAGEKPDTDADPGAEAKDEASESGDSTEAILPRSILAGKEFNVGDEVVLKITAMRDNEISVAYAPAKSKDEGGEAKMPEGMAGGGDSDYE